MAEQDSLIILEATATAQGFEALQDKTVDISYSGLRNSSTYLLAFMDLKRKHGISNTALSLLRLCVLLRPSMSRVSKMLSELAQKTKSPEDRKAAREASLWLAAYVSEHSNTDGSKIPIHAITQSHAQNNFELLATCSASLSSIQFLMLLIGQRWLSQIKLGTEGLRSTHEEMTKLFWTSTVTKSNRDKSSYASGSRFEQGFNREYYLTSCMDQSDVVIGSKFFESSDFGSSTWEGYSMKVFIKLRQEFLMRLKEPTKLFDLELAKTSVENFNKVVKVCTPSFLRELDDVMPHLMIGQCIASLKTNSLSTSEAAALESVGLIKYKTGKSYLEEGIVIGSLSGHGYNVMEATVEFPTSSPARLARAKRALSAIEVPDPEREGSPSKQARTSGSPIVEPELPAEKVGEAGPVKESAVGSEAQEGFGKEIQMSLEGARALKESATAEVKEYMIAGVEAGIYNRLQENTQEALMVAIMNMEEYSMSKLQATKDDYESVVEAHLVTMLGEKLLEVIASL